MLAEHTKTEKIAIDQVRRLSAQSTLGIIATMVNAVIMAVLLSTAVPKLRVVVWLGAVLLVSIARLLIQHFIKKEINSENFKARRKYLLFTLGLSAGLWGLASIFLFPHTSFTHQVLLVLVIGGLVAGSVGVFASIMAAFYSFSIPTVGPLTIQLISIGDDLHYGMAVMSILFWFLMHSTARRLNRAMHSFLTLKYENIGLINDLEKEVRERQAAQEKLLAKNQQIESIVATRTTELRHVNEKLRAEIDDRIKIEKALRESKKKFVELADFLPQMVFETDVHGNITFANRNAVKYFGSYDAPKRLNVVQLIRPKERERAEKNFKAILKGEPRDTEEYIALRKDGSSFPIVIHSALVLRNGKPAGIRGIMIDLTEEKKAAEEQRQLEARLQRAQKMEILGTTAGGVAHDLNNILSGIVSYPDLMLMQLPSDSPLWTPMHTIRESGKKAAAIVQDLLTLTRRGVVSQEVVNLNDVVNEYLQSPEHAKMISFHPETHTEVFLEKALVNIMGSRVHLAKTIMNLVSNAAEAMPDGGAISITTVNRYIDQPIRGYDAINDGDYAVLSVADTGIGIAPEDIERIFEPFFTKKVMGRSGTGLGMAVVWGTVKDHKGYIDVNSAKGRGTTFSLYFPVTGEKERSTETPAAAITYRGKGERILVVDDTSEQRRIASEMLLAMGYQAITIASGEDAIAYLDGHKVDLILLDMIMEPGMDGLGTYAKIVERYGRQKTVITSGFSETKRVKEARQLGAGPCLMKPYSMSQLGRAIHAMLYGV
jgi:two-component system cell cycle sensor histidine kinase/response regulator CckA